MLLLLSSYFDGGRLGRILVLSCVELVSTLVQLLLRTGQSFQLWNSSRKPFIEAMVLATLASAVASLRALSC